MGCGSYRNVATSVKLFCFRGGGLYDDQLKRIIVQVPDIHFGVEGDFEHSPSRVFVNFLLIQANGKQSSDNGHIDDTAMANTYYILRDHGIELKLV